MKRFEDLSKKEILSLTGEQIEKYIDMKCAENGVPVSSLKKCIKKLIMLKIKMIWLKNYSSPD